MSVAFLVTAFAGFAPTYYLKGLSDAPPLRPLLHLHALVFTAWLLLLFSQAALVAARRVALHRRLGILGAMLAAVIVPLGIMTALDAARRGAAPQGMDPYAFLLFPLGNILLFAGFITIALWKRRHAESHRRLIMLATISLMTPALARLPFVGTRPILALMLTLLFVVAALIHDWRTRGRMHAINLWGGLILLVSGPARFGLGQTDAWQSFARLLVE